MKNEVICEVLEENITRCLQCRDPLKFCWLTQEEQEKLLFIDLEPEFRNGSQLSQVGVCFCPKCGWKKPSLLVKTEHENILSNEEKEKYQKERDLVEKIATILLPNQSVRIRFVKSIIYENEEKMARTFLFKIPELENKEFVSICFSIELLVKKDKITSGLFADVVAHELAHATPEVFKNPQRNPDQKIFPNCSCRRTDVFFNPHSGKGHDKIWHDKYDEFREIIKNENLTENSGYQALGMNFEYGKNDEREKQKERSVSINTKKELSQLGNKTYWIIGSLVLISLIGLIIWFVFKEEN